MNGPNMWKPAAIGGILLGVLSSVPLVSCACCAWIIGGGILAAYLYVKESPAVVTLGQGVFVGFLAGVIGTVVFALFSIPLLLMSSEGRMEFAAQFQKITDLMPGFFPPESRKAFIDLTSRQGFGAILYIMTMGVQFLGDCLLASLGGALGVAIFEKRKPGGPSSQAPVNEPPEALPPPPPPDL